MHQEVLIALSELGAYEPGELSRRTGLSVPLVEQLMSELHERGYIEPLASECATGCSTCSCPGGCEEPQLPQGWAFTDKGTALLESAERPALATAADERTLQHEHNPEARGET